METPIGILIKSSWGKFHDSCWYFRNICSGYPPAFMLSLPVCLSRKKYYHLLPFRYLFTENLILNIHSSISERILVLFKPSPFKSTMARLQSWFIVDEWSHMRSEAWYCFLCSTTPTPQTSSLVIYTSYIMPDNYLQQCFTQWVFGGCSV